MKRDKRVNAETERATCCKHQTEKAIAEKKSLINKLECEIRDLVMVSEEIKEELNRTEAKYLEGLELFTRENSLDGGMVLDLSFMERLLSVNIKESTTAQVMNPWFTKRYNVERTKLFYYAMQLNKEFVLSSHQHWHLWEHFYMMRSSQVSSEP